MYSASGHLSLGITMRPVHTKTAYAKKDMHIHRQT